MVLGMPPGGAEGCIGGLSSLRENPAEQGECGNPRFFTFPWPAMDVLTAGSPV
jgi:hypothetical protein